MKDLLLVKIFNSLQIYCKSPSKVNIEWIKSSEQKRPASPAVTNNNNRPVATEEDGSVKVSEWELNESFISAQPNLPADFKITCGGKKTIDCYL